MENVVNQRLNNLDVVKAICAFLVICIHISYKEDLGNIITPLCRIAVPLFFMITGYFYHKTSKKPLKQIKKVLILTILANLLYFIFCRQNTYKKIFVFFNTNINRYKYYFWRIFDSNFR